MAIDPETARVAVRLAVIRWNRPMDAPIRQRLDEPDECVREANAMNTFLPRHLQPEGYGWRTVTASEIFAAQIATVRQYAGMIYVHMVRLAEIQMIDLSELPRAEVELKNDQPTFGFFEA